MSETWGRLGTTVAFHPKIMLAGNEAIGLWARSISYCVQQLTDGDLPREIVIMMSGGNADLAARLVAVGLWDETPTGYAFHDWHEWQETRESVKRKRELGRERQDRYRKNRGKQGDDDASDNAPRDASPADEPFAPVVVEPKSKTTKSGAYSADFLAFYDAYPRKTAKLAASRAFESLRKRKLLPATDELVAITKRFATASAENDPQFIPHPATWLNSGRFSDEEAGATVTPLDRHRDEATERKRLWLEDRGSSLEEYARMKNTPGWLEQLQLKGKAE